MFPIIPSIASACSKCRNLTPADAGITARPRVACRAVAANRIISQTGNPAASDRAHNCGGLRWQQPTGSNSNGIQRSAVSRSIFFALVAPNKAVPVPAIYQGPTIPLAIPFPASGADGIAHLGRPVQPLEPLPDQLRSRRLLPLPRMEANRTPEIHDDYLDCRRLPGLCPFHAQRPCASSIMCRSSMSSSWVAGAAGRSRARTARLAACLHRHSLSSSIGSFCFIPRMARTSSAFPLPAAWKESQGSRRRGRGP